MCSKKLISSAEAAKILKVSLRTIQLWTEKGVLSAWKTPGGHRRIALESVLTLRHEQNVQTGFMIEKLKVLIIEEDAQQRALYNNFFTKWSLRIDVNIVEDGYQGLMKIGAVNPDLLITELTMPAMDTFQMINAIRVSEGNCDLEIIVITALDKDTGELVRLPYENITVMQKPLSFEDLKCAMDTKFLLFRE